MQEIHAETSEQMHGPVAGIDGDIAAGRKYAYRDGQLADAHCMARLRTSSS